MRAMQNYDRLSIVVSLVLLGLALTLLINLPTRLIQTELFGTPIAIAISTRLVMAILLSALSAVGVEYILRAHPDFGADRGSGYRFSGYSFPFWILPALVTLAAAWLTPRLIQQGILPWLAGLLGTAGLLSAVIVAEYTTIRITERGFTLARLFLNAVTYFSALVLFSTLYQAKMRSIISASSVAFFAAILALSLLRGERNQIDRTWLYAIICGMILGEATWALNYWGVGGLAGGTLLMLIFYLFTGLSQQRLLHRFGRPVLVEFLVVSGIGLFLLAAQGALIW